MAPWHDFMSYRVTQEVENISNRCFAGYILLCLLAVLFLSFYTSTLLCFVTLYILILSFTDWSFLNMVSMHKAADRKKDQASYIQTGIGALHDCLSPLSPTLSFYTIHHSHWYPLYLLTYRLIPSLFHHPSFREHIVSSLTFLELLTLAVKSRQ